MLASHSKFIAPASKSKMFFFFRRTKHFFSILDTDKVRLGSRLIIQEGREGIKERLENKAGVKV